MPKAKGGKRPARCQKCNRADDVLVWYRRQWICGPCLNGSLEPLRIEDFLRGSGALGDDGAMPGECALEYGEGSFHGKLDRRLKKHGLNISRGKLKASLFAGADAGKAAKKARWDAEEGEG